MASGIRDFTVTFVSRALVLLVGVATQSILAWFLEPAGRGSYAVAVMYSSLVATFFTFGLDCACLYFSASKKMTPSESVSANLTLCVVAGMLAAAFSLAAIHLPIPFFAKASRTAFWLATATIPVTIVYQVLALQLMALKEFEFTAIMAIGEALLQATGIAVVLIVFHLSVEGAVTVLLLSQICFIILSMIFLRRRYKVAWVRPTRNRINDLLSYGWRSYIGSASNVLGLYAGTLLLAMYASEAEIGMFAVATGLLLRINMIPDAVGNVVQPRIAGDPTGRPELAAQSARVIGVICGLAILLICAFAKPLVAILFSDKFFPAIPLLYILAPAFFFRCATKVLVPYLNGTNHPGVASAATVASIAVSIITLVVLYPMMGLPGAAVSQAASYAMTALFMLVGFHHYSRMPMHCVFGLRRSDSKPFNDLLKALRARLRPAAANPRPADVVQRTNDRELNDIENRQR